MLMDKCVACHRTGGIGPWQMTSYDMIKGFAPMIREVVRTQRMPPWDVDPHYSVFSNDRGLSIEQARTLVHWIEAGAPRGTGADPLLAQKKDWPEWPLGKPDLIVELPAFTVPATGTIPYQMTKVENPLDHDVWVRAVDWVPGERSVVHHIIASAGGAERRGAVSLNNYVPGVEPLRAAAGSRHPAAGESDLPLPDALHVERQGAHRQDEAGPVLPQGRAEVQLPQSRVREQQAAHSAEHEVARGSGRTDIEGRRDPLHAASACALSRQGVALRRVLPGRQGTDAAEHPGL